MATKMAYLTIFCAAFFSIHKVRAQYKNKFAVSTEFLQIKEEFNHGMVFNGPQVGFQYLLFWNFPAIELRYSPKVALGLPFNRGMIAANINFTPIDVSCFKAVYQSENHSLKAGLNFASNYSYQSYPDLQSARLFWFGEIGLSPAIEYQYKWAKRAIQINLQNSLLGFVSRTKNYNPYFYSFRFSSFFTAPHKDLQFGSFDKYNHTKAQIDYTSNKLNTNSFSLGMEYVGVYFNAHFQSLSYYLQWRKLF